MLASLVLANSGVNQSCGSPILQITFDVEDGFANITSQADIVAVLNGTIEVNGMMPWETVTIDLEIQDVRDDDNESLGWTALVEPSTLVFESDGVQTFLVRVTVPHSTNITKAHIILSGTIRYRWGSSAIMSPTRANLNIVNNNLQTDKNDKDTNDNGEHKTETTNSFFPLISVVLIALVAMIAIALWVMKKAE